MPKQVLPSQADFRRIRQELTSRGFREISSYEFTTQFRRLGLKAPRSKPGRETGFIFHANGLDVFVWTTWLKKEERAREKDTGWVLICEKDEAVYFGQPTHRTKNFVANLLSRAWIAMWRVLHRPLCPECYQWMQIVSGRGVRSRYWRCNNTTVHKSGGHTQFDWDYGLPPKAKQYTEGLRGERARYRAKRRGEGKPTDVARQLRKSWRMSRTPA